MVTRFSSPTPLKAFLPMLLRLAALMVMLLSFVMFLNAELPILATFSPIVSLVTVLLFLRAFFPISATTKYCSFTHISSGSLRVVPVTSALFVVFKCIQKPLRAFRPRRCKKFIRLILLHDMPPVEEKNTIGNRLCKRHLVGNDEHGALQA